jgi:hypothetical protein
VATLAFAPVAFGGHGTEPTSSNMTHLANVPKAGTTNSDLAFWGNLVYAGNYGGFRIIDVSNPSAPVVLSDYFCVGSQGDVGVWKHRTRTLLFVSVDSRQPSGECNKTGPASWEGIRIFDVSNPTAPFLIKAIPTDCGSHTHTVVPDLARTRVLIYVSSYLLGAPTTGPGGTQCGPVHGHISVIDVPLRRPQNAHVVSEPSTGPGTDGCHDIGVFIPLKIAAAACITEGQIWDISNPVNPVITARILNSTIEIWHSGAFTYDAAVAVFGDEEGGAAATHGCTTRTPPGSMWFYDTAVLGLAGPPAVPTTYPFLGQYTIPRPQPGAIVCTAHNYDVVPLPHRYILASAWYQGGTSVVDFTNIASNPAAATEIGYFDAAGTDGAPAALTWSSYWYNGLIYANDIDRGVDIFRYTGSQTNGALTFGRLNPQTQETLIP